MGAVVAVIGGGATQLDRISADPQPAQLPQQKVDPEEVARAQILVRRSGQPLAAIPVSPGNLLTKHQVLCPATPCGTAYVATGDNGKSRHVGVLSAGVAGSVVPLDKRLVYYSATFGAWVLDTETGRREPLHRSEDR